MEITFLILWYIIGVLSIWYFAKKAQGKIYKGDYIASFIFGILGLFNTILGIIFIGFDE
jgi:hypothetical protein